MIEELSFRFLVIARVSAFIGLAAWRDVVFLLAGRNRVFLFSGHPPRGALVLFFPRLGSLERAIGVKNKVVIASG